MQNGCYIFTYKWPISQKSFLKFNSKASVLEILGSEVRREGETSEASMSNKHGQHPDPFKASDPEDTLLKLTGELCALFYELKTLRIMSNRCWSASGHLSHMRDGSLSTYSAIDLHFFFSTASKCRESNKHSVRWTKISERKLHHPDFLPNAAAQKP